MDLLAQHEAFLRAIFDAPDDDTPRLVYADFLDENGEPAQAERIRWQCGSGPRPANVPDFAWRHERGFPPPWVTATVTPDQLLDTAGLRGLLVREYPDLFAAEEVRILGGLGGRISSAEPFDVVFGLTAFARVTELELRGAQIVEGGATDPAFETFRLEPVITTAGVEALARHRGLVRVTSLDLRNNNLDNDAARALAKSPYLDNLKHLQLLDGNRLRGKVWQQVIERFGEDAVG